MARIKLKYVTKDTDRHGNVRYYFRRRGRPKIRLNGVPGSHDFMLAYKDALAGLGSKERAVSQVPRGSFLFVCREYYGSPEFNALDRSTQSWERRHLDSICRSHGDNPIAKMEGRHIRALRDQLVDKPGASKTRLKALRALFRWAVERGYVQSDPTRDVKALRYEIKGHHSWTSEEIAVFKRSHPVGTKARLAMDILLFTACRREDVVRLGPQHISMGRIRFTQAKNEGHNPVEIDIPLAPELIATLDATPSGHLNFLVTEYQKPFSVAGFGNKFRQWCNEAGLPHCSAHGLRKAAAAKLAECGATPHEIMAVTGHRSLAEVERYTRAARKSELADVAIAKLKR